MPAAQKIISVYDQRTLQPNNISRILWLQNHKSYSPSGRCRSAVISRNWQLSRWFLGFWKHLNSGSPGEVGVADRQPAKQVQLRRGRPGPALGACPAPAEEGDGEAGKAADGGKGSAYGRWRRRRGCSSSTRTAVAAPIPNSARERWGRESATSYKVRARSKGGKRG